MDRTMIDRIGSYVLHGLSAVGVWLICDVLGVLERFALWLAVM